MIKQHIIVGNNKWNVLIYYDVGHRDGDKVLDMLLDLGCPYDDAVYATNVVTTQLNTGLTFSNMDTQISFVCVSDTTSMSQLASTVVHEMKHVQSHICSYYNVDESGEQAAYLIGFLARQVYKLLSRFI